MKVGALLLAAGASSRMGGVKQLLPYEGQSLVGRAAGSALNSVCCSVFGVLGANLNSIRTELATLPIHLFENADWATGLGSSIRCGIRGARRLRPDLAGVVLLLADQPFVTAETINRLIVCADTNQAAVVVSSYSGTLGVPAFFPRDTFNDLENLRPDQGAKQLFTRYQDRLISVPAPEAEQDIDTPQQYKELSELTYAKAR